MKWFRPLKIVFICEQKGETEQEFKKAITFFLKQFEEPCRAYLCSVAYRKKDNKNSVALCIAGESQHKQEILERSASIFQNMFGENEYLDVIFLTDKQEKRLLKVCNSFLEIL